MKEKMKKNIVRAIASLGAIAILLGAILPAFMR